MAGFATRMALTIGEKSPEHFDSSCIEHVRSNQMGAPDFEQLVGDYYPALYRFALSLARSEAVARDLVQQTFYLWATKGGQLRDGSKAKAWLFTTLHREFLAKERREIRFPHTELDEANDPLPPSLPEPASLLDSETVLMAVQALGEVFRAPVALFYLEDYSYQAIAEVLEIPIGTVKSRISRGILQMHKQLTRGTTDTDRRREEVR